MMSSNVSASNAEQYVEERLLNGLFTGSLNQHKELLDVLEEVDARVIKQSTLLHVGVRLGKVDWVEELLARGADPQLTDDNQVDALSSAKEMVCRFPENWDCSQVLKLVTLVQRRDQVMMNRLQSSSSQSTDYKTSVDMSKHHIESLRSSVEALRQEMKSIVSQLSSSLDEVKAQVCGRDTLLRFLEEAVTSTAENVASMKCGPFGETVVNLLPSNMANARQKCVEAMLRKTEIMYGDGVDIMRRYYGRIFDEDDCTACIMKYLSGDDRVKVLVDCESSHIGRMKDKFVNLDGTRENGYHWISFCDLVTDAVYLGAKVCWDNSEKGVAARLARSLSLLSFKFAFGNRGLPYEHSNTESESEWMRALQEVVERRKRGGRLHWYINYALEQRTQFAKVCWLAAVVPEISIHDGSAEGRGKLQEQAPLLLSMFSNQVVPTLLAKARR
ncbi:uncharacterized protein LOC124173048 isoform X2 [Ischnura elegans]|uniref:uncharacterized protein LOC124173048 isoform X2 n=1 Tax=Ischnura elegans TaxID=197161 RepID=UPI001ED88DC2|nr:uncharacterized protein LOC124173048 isoform X2 [Ischnura elegans]